MTDVGYGQNLILPPYHNPPYKAPTTPKNSLSPPSSRSPKRKRGDLNGALLVSDGMSVSHEYDKSGASSPRMKVAEKFRDLDLRQTRPDIHQTIPRQAVPRKRLKRNRNIAAKLSVDHSSVVGTPERDHLSSGQEPGEVGETPDCHVKIHSSSPISSTQANPIQSEAHVPTSIEDEPAGIQLTASSPTSLTVSDAVGPVDRSASPLPSREDLTSDQAALTWQEDEITGHDIDPSGDDDGEGINGIGFKPTPAIVQARQQKRRQQVNEWKARETRDARQRRFDRRRGSTTMSRGTNTSSPIRTVRFDGVG